MWCGNIPQVKQRNRGKEKKLEVGVVGGETEIPEIVSQSKQADLMRDAWQGLWVVTELRRSQATHVGDSHLYYSIA